MIPDSALFQRLSEEPAWCPRIVDIGMVHADVPADQPPYIGIMVELEYLQFDPPIRSTIMLKLSIALALPTLRLLRETMRAIVDEAKPPTTP